MITQKFNNRIKIIILIRKYWIIFCWKTEEKTRTYAISILSPFILREFLRIKMAANCEAE